MGGWNGKTPFAGARPPKGKFDNWDSRTKFIVPLLEVLRASPSPVVFVFIAGLKGLGKSSIIDFVTYVYKRDLENARGCIEVRGTKGDLDEIRQRIEDRQNDTPIVVCWHVNNEGSDGILEQVLYRVSQIIDWGWVNTADQVKMILVVESYQPYPEKVWEDKDVVLPLTIRAGESGRRRSPQPSSERGRVDEKLSISKAEFEASTLYREEWRKIVGYHKVNIWGRNAFLLRYTSPLSPLSKEEVDRWINGEDGHITISEDYWESRPHEKYCPRKNVAEFIWDIIVRWLGIGQRYHGEKSRSPMPIHLWAGRHPLLLASAVGELCKQCRDGGARCSSRLLGGLEGVDDNVSQFLKYIRESLPSSEKDGVRELKLKDFGLLTPEGEVVEAVDGISRNVSWLEVILELVYWKWYIEEDMKHVRSDFRQEVIDLVEEIRAGRWFPQSPPLNDDGHLDIRESTRQRLLQEAQERYHRQPLSEEGQKAIRKKLVAWLEYYELEVVIQRCERCVGNSHRDISDAETLVESIDVSKLAQLVVTMYDVESMLSELRDLLNRLDDEDVRELCIVHFSHVADKLGDGMGKQGKINVLLDHCRRYPQKGERLRRILDAEVALPNASPSASGGNNVTITGDKNIVITGNNNRVQKLSLGASDFSKRVFSNPNSSVGSIHDPWLEVILELVYWKWHIEQRTGSVYLNFSQEVIALVEEIGADRWFPQWPLLNDGRLDIRESTRWRLLQEAQERYQQLPLSEKERRTIERKLVAWLREERYYGLELLHMYYQDHTDNDPAWYRIGTGDRAMIAEKLEAGTIRELRLAELVKAMRDK